MDKCCGYKHAQKMKQAVKPYIGMTEEEAVKAIQGAGLKARIRARDGQAFMGTMDMDEGRINLTIEAGKVTQASIG